MSDSDSMSFNPWMVGREKNMTYLKEMEELRHVPGDALHRLLPQGFNVLAFEGRASRQYKEYERILYLLQSSRRWETIGLSDKGQTRASPEFLSLVVLALTKTNFVTVCECPADENFFACLNSGMQTLTYVKLISGNIRISYNAAAIFGNGLALSTSLENLEICEECVFGPGAGVHLAEGIRRNKSLKKLIFSESNLSSVAMASILDAVSEGSLPKLETLELELQPESDCINALTKLMSSDTSHVENLDINANFSFPNIFQAGGARFGKANLKLKSLKLNSARFDESSYLTTMLPKMPALSHLNLGYCDISDITPIIDHLCLPNTTTIKSIKLHSNRFGIDQAEKFVQSLTDMKSLTDVDFTDNPQSITKSLDRKRANYILRIVSNCHNLERFAFWRYYGCTHWGKKNATEFERILDLNMAINRAWRRELCYKKSSPPANLFPLVIARALRKTEKKLRADVLLPLLRERISDLMPASDD